MKTIKNYNEAKQITEMITKAHVKLRQYRKTLPTRFGKKLLKATRVPVKTKDGKTVTYKTKHGRKPRYRNVKSWKELTERFYIVPKNEYLIMKRNK